MNARPNLSRTEVRALLLHYRITGDGPTPEDVVTGWWRGLRDYSAGECQAALASINPQRVRHTTPAEVAKLVDAARLRPVAGAPSSARPPLPRDPADKARERTRYAAAGSRGIRAVYAAMGWQRHPDTDLAGTVRCGFCRAQVGQVCRPLVRRRDGKREQRDPTTRMHPSRLAQARAKQAAGTPSTTRGTRTAAQQGVSA